jgi:hypothetical protein
VEGVNVPDHLARTLAIAHRRGTPVRVLMTDRHQARKMQKALLRYAQERPVGKVRIEVVTKDEPGELIVWGYGR